MRRGQWAKRAAYANWARLTARCSELVTRRGFGRINVPITRRSPAEIRDTHEHATYIIRRAMVISTTTCITWNLVNTVRNSSASVLYTKKMACYEITSMTTMSSPVLRLVLSTECNRMHHSRIEVDRTYRYKGARQFKGMICMKV